MKGEHPVKLFDSHCHLFMEPLYADIDGVILRAAHASVTRVMVPAFDRDSFRKVIELSSRTGICGALGLHPWCASEGLDPEELEELLSASDVRAVGEIGLDFKIDDHDRQLQINLFRSQLQVAAELGMPVILHCRGAFDEMLDILGSTEFRCRLTGVLHAFSRGPELASRFLDLGFSLAFGGAVTRSGARRALRSAAFTPSDRILLETDAPSIGLDGVKSGDSEPAHLLRISEAMARLRDVSVQEIAELTCWNTRQLFRIDEDD